MTRKRQDAIRIIILLLSIETWISSQQPFPDTEDYIPNENHDVTTFQNKTSAKTQQSNDGYYLDLLSGICREGWVKGRINDVTVCLRTNTHPLSWSDARDTCRKDFSFLIKMEAPVSVESRKLKDYLKIKNIDNIWTGIHEEGGYLVWDEISPHKVRAYNDPLEDELLQRRNWKWNIEPDDDDEDSVDNDDFEFHEESRTTCGLLNFNQYIEKHTLSKRSGEKMLKHIKQNDDIPELEQTPAPGSREVETPQDIRGHLISESRLRALKRYIEQSSRQSNRRRTTFNANKVKKFIESQRKLLEKQENDRDFTTNLNEAIEPVQPTEETDFPDERKDHPKSLYLRQTLDKSKTLTGLTADLEDSNSTFEGVVTPRSILTTAASLVSIPTRPTRPVIIPLPTDPAYENFTMNGQKANFTEHKLAGVPIPTFRPEEETNTRKENQKDKKVKNAHPADVVDYEDLLFRESKKNTTQSNVKKPTPKTKIQRTAKIPTKPIVPPKPSVHKKPTKQTASKKIESISSSEEMTDISPIGIANISEKVSTLETDKEEKIRQILDFLVSSSESGDSTEDTDEIDDSTDPLELNNILKQQKQITTGNEAERVLPQKEPPSIVIPPAIITNSRKSHPSKSSSSPSDERKHRASETDEFILTDEIKSNSNEKSASKTKLEKSSEQFKASKAVKIPLEKIKTPKPVLINIGHADSEELKAYLDAMKPTTKEDGVSDEGTGKETKSKSESGSNPTTLFNTKAFYDLPETSKEKKSIASKSEKKISEESNEDEKQKSNQIKTKTDARGGVPLSLAMLHSDNTSEDDNTDKQDQRQDIANKSPSTHKQKSTKLKKEVSAIPIPVSVIEKNEDKLIKENIKREQFKKSNESSEESTEKTSNLAKNIKEEKTTMDSTDKFRSNQRKAEMEENFSESLSSDTLSFEDEEKDRDKKRKFNKNMKKITDSFPPPINITKPQLQTQIKEQPKQKDDKSSLTEKSDELVEDSLESNVILNKTKPTAKASLNDKTENVKQLSNEKESSEEIQNNSETDDYTRTTTSATKISANAPPIPLDKLKKLGSSNLDRDKSEEKAEIPKPILTTQSSSLAKIESSKTENSKTGVNQRQTAGGIIIPTQSNDIFSSLIDKSMGEGKHMISNSREFRMKSNVFSKEKLENVNPLETTSVSLEVDDTSQIESSSEESLVSTDSSTVTSSTLRDNGDDSDLSKDIRESEPDDAILVIDRSNKNKTDSYSSDEESDETKEMKTVTIIPGVEDYVSTSASEEEVSKEIKATLPMPITSIQVRKFETSEEKDVKSLPDETKKVDTLEEGNVRKGSDLDKSTEKNSSNEKKIKKILIKGDERVNHERVKITETLEKETSEEPNRELVSANHEENDRKTLDIEKNFDIKQDFERQENVMNKTKISLQSSIESNESSNVKHINGTVTVNKIKQASSNRNVNNEISAKESVSNEDEIDDDNKTNSNGKITSLATSDISTDSNHKPKDKSRSKDEDMSKEKESTPSSISHLTSHTQFNTGSADINSRKQASTSMRAQTPNSTQSTNIQGNNGETDENSSEENVSSNDMQTSTSSPVQALHEDPTLVIKKNKTDADDDLSSEETVLMSTTVNLLSKDINLESIEDKKDESKIDIKETVSSEERDVTTSSPTKSPNSINTTQESSEHSKDSAEIAGDKQSGSSNTTVNQLHNSVTDVSKSEITEKNSDLESKEDISHPTDSLPTNDVVDANSGENIQLDATKQASDEKSLLPPSHVSKEADSAEEIDKVVLQENVGKNNSNESDANIIPMMNHSNEEDKSNILADSVEFKNTVKDESHENIKDLNVSVNRTDDKPSLSLSEEKTTTKPSLKDNSSSSESAENNVESSEEDNDRVVRFRNSEENKLMRSGNYEFKDFYDHNNEIEDDDAMYRKEVNRDKMERDKHFKLKSSSEMPIVLEAIRNIDDSREQTQTIKSDEAFRSLFEKLNNRSKSLMAEAASKDEFRHREDQDLDFAGIRAGEMSDDMDMDPEDILAQEADLKAEARVNQALLPSFQKSQTNPKITFNDGKAHMKLSNCNSRRTSMCYTYPVTVESEASTCDSGWVGHVFHTKCYRIMRNANTIPKMPYKDAMSICKMEGGSIAELNDGYKGNYLLMTLLKSIKEHMRELPPKEDIPPIWVRRGTQDSSCSVMTLSGPIAMGCNQSMAVAVCEKNANDIRIQNSRTMNKSLAIKEFAINDKKILQCDLKNSALELPILWFKDGRLIDIKVKKRKSSIFPHLGGRPISPLPEPAETDVTSLELNTWLRKTLETSTDQSLTDEIFQGHYWCAAWKTNPFVREKSREIFVRFTDVISFVGIILLPAIPYDERLLHNKIEKNLPPILNIMTDLRYINNIVFRKLQQEFPNLESTSAYPGDISSKPPLLLSFNVYIRASKNYTTADEMPLYKSMRTRYQEILRDGNILTRLPRGTPLRFIRSLKIRSTVSCQQTTLTDPRTRLAANFFPAGINLNVSSIDVCENGERAGRATCKGNFKSGAHWSNIQITRRCGTPDTRMEENDEDSNDQLLDDEEQGEEYENLVQRMTAEERLRELAEMEIEENNLESVIEETAEIADTVEDFKEIDLEYINEIMEKSAISNGKSRFVTAKALETVDRLLTVDDMVFQKAKRVSSIIKNFEKIVEDTDLSDDGHFRLVLPNVAMEIYELGKFSQPVIGMAAKTDENGKAVYTPFNQQRIVSIYNESVFYDDIDVAIHLPPELVEETKAENKSRLYMMVYRDGNMFQDSSMPSNVQRTTSESKRSNNKKLNSFVISASIGGRKIEGLKQKVKTIFRPLKDVGGRTRTCAFYNFTLNNMAGGWSSAGCTYDGQVNGRDICLCDHLTNFAVLVDYYGQDDRVDHVHEVSLSIISLIGLSLSILGLSLTIISFVFFRKLRKGRAQQTLFNLALSMLCSWVIFLVGIKQTYHFIGCLIVAILLHYFILASFMWMLMEAFLQYLTFVKVLGTYVTRYTLKSVIAAWGLPVIPIISVLSVDHNLYKGGDHYCWMSLDAFYYAFAIPVGVIILANLVIFIITVVSIFRRPQGLRSNQSKHKMAITNLQAAITSFVLLGLSWILGYFAISDARLPFQYAFTILSSLQGFFIFVLFVARKKQVREQWKMICCCIYPDQQKAQRTLSASASYPSTCSSRSTSSTSTLHHQGRTDRSDSCKTTTSFIGTEYDSIYTVPYSRASRDSLYYRKL